MDHDGLYRLAESQAGYFTTGQARAVGMDRSTLAHHARPGGRFERIRRGLYRLRHFPSSPHEHLLAAWLSFGATPAVISHESALELYELSDVIPDAVHVTVPRAQRGQRPRPGVRVHALQQPPQTSEIRSLHGLPVTSPERTIVDALDAGAQPEQIGQAVRQALDRGLTTAERLQRAASARSPWVRRSIASALDEAHE